MRTETLPVSGTVFPGIFFISAATLLLEIGWTRVLSVTLWYHFAFMVLSTALFGFGFAGVLLALRKNAGTISPSLLAFAACSTPPAFVFGYCLFNFIPFEPFSLGRDFRQWLYLPLSYLAVTLPFFFSGLTIAALMTRHADKAHHLYLFDLVGAGLGSLSIVFCLERFGGSGTIFIAAAFAGLGAFYIMWERGASWRVMTGGGTVLLVLMAPFGEQLLPVRISSNKVTGSVVPTGRVLADSRFHRLTAWNTISRIDVIEFKDRNGALYRNVLIDGGTALTRLVHLERPISDLKPADDEESFFLRLFPSPQVLVVGSGGGREVLLALRSKASAVTAVEINPAINKLVTEQMADFTGHVYDDPRVKVYTDEARSFLRRSPDKYDVIHCPHTISNAAMTSGSLSLAENYLLTLEAFVDYLEHLSDKGVVLITRPEAHLPRLFSTVREAWKGPTWSGMASCVMAWRRPSSDLSFYAGAAFRRVPFTPSEIQNFSLLLDRAGLEPLYLPGKVMKEPYQSLAQGVEINAVPLPFAAILAPATDDRPFFNRRVSFSQIRWSDLRDVFSSGPKGRLALEERPVAEAALLVLLVESIGLALLFIVMPVMMFQRRPMEKERQSWILIAFFFLGLAYIIVEVGLIQRLTLYLGRPAVVFATVLGTLLISSGMGSAFSRRLSGKGAAACVAALSAGFIVFFVSRLLPPILQETLAWSQELRVMLVIFFLALPGLVMGMPFPLLIHQLNKRHSEQIPWAMGINGFASVIGSIGAVVLGMISGWAFTLFVGVSCYLLAALAAGIGVSRVQRG